MKKLSFERLWENLKRKISILTIVSLVLTGLTPATSVLAESHFTNDVYQFVDELEIEDTLVNEGMFYIPHSHLEVKENTDNKKFVFKVLRKGEIEKYEKVKLTMMDITGKYGKDYTIKVIDKAAFSENVKNINKSKSILEYAAKNEGDEYNYSDAIIDGTLNSENIMTDEEKENFTMSEEEKERMLNVANEALTNIGIDAKVEGVGDTTSLDGAEDNESTSKDFEEEADEDAINATVTESYNEDKAENDTANKTNTIDEQNNEEENIAHSENENTVNEENEQENNLNSENDEVENAAENNAEENNIEENAEENTNEEENNSEDNSEDNSENTTTTNEDVSDETVKGFTNTDTTITAEANNNNSDNVGTTNGEHEDSVGAKLREPEDVSANDDNVEATDGEPEETTSKEQTSEETTSEEPTEPVDGTTNEPDETEAEETEAEDESTTVAETTVEDTTAETTTAETTTAETTTAETTTEESTNETTTTSENTTTENSTNAKDINNSKVEKEETNKEETTKSEGGNLNESVNDLYGDGVATDSDVDTEVSTMSEIVYGEEEVKFDTKIATLSSSKAYELVTGLKDDRKKVVPDRSGTPLDIINPNSLENKAFMNEGVEAVEEELKSAYVELNFKPNQVEKLIEITIIDDNKYRGKKQVGFHLSSEDNKNIAGAYSTLTLIIEDDEPVEKSYINFTKTSYEPKDGYVHVEMERTGDVGSIATVMLDSEDITAVHGRDYSEVHTKVVFGMGLTKRHINIPVVSTHINKSASFKLKLQEAEGAEVGDKGNTICTIKDTDINFKFANPKLTDKNESENLFGGAKTDDDNLFGDSGEQKITRDKIRYGSEIELQNSINRFIQRKCGDDTYIRDINNGYGLEIYVDDGEFFCLPSRCVSVWVYLKYNHLIGKEGYKGIEIDWSKGTKGKNTDNGDIVVSTDVKTLKSFKGGKWNDRQDLIWFENTTFPDEIDIGVHRYYGYHYKSPTVVINSIKPIHAMYDVKLLNAKAPGFINKDGELEPNNHHGGNDGTRISDGTGEMVDVGYIGKEVTVRLNNDNDYAPYYLKNLYIAKDENGNGLVEIASNGNNTTAKSISFMITEDFLQKYKGYIHQIDGIGEKAHGSKDGEFYILAGLEKKPSRVRITKDDRIDIDIWGKKPTQETEKEYIYDYGIEDTIRLNGKIKNKYKGAFTFTGFEKVYVVPRDKENSSINVSYDEDYCTYMLDASEILLTPNVVEPNNTIVVRVPKNQDSLFDKNYGFMKTVRPTLNGNYYDYVVASKGTRIYAQHFELKAKTKNNNNVAVWVETYKSQIKYVQDTFYFLGAAKPEQNIIVLTAEKADKNNYSISGVTYYEEQPLGSKTTGEYWQGASRVGILIDDKTFGYSNEKGEFITVPSKGKNGYYKRAKIVSDGDNIYKDIKLNQKNIVNQTYEVEYKDGIKTQTERIYNVNSQNILISNFNSNHPKVNFVRALTSISGMRHDSRYIKINDKMTTLGANVSSKKPDGTPYTYTYTDEYDIVRTATESITKVEFLVVDPKSHEIKKVIEASKSSDDVWLSQSVFNKGKYNEYKADDVLYVRLTTDRKIGDGKGDVITEDGERKEIPIFNETVYQAINTNIVFSSVADTVPVEVDFDLEKISPTSEELSLPVIGMLTFFKKFGGISFKSETDGDIVRVKIGKEFRTRGNNYDEKGEEINDSDAGKKITKHNFKEGFSAMKERMLADGSYNEKLKRMTLGLPVWSITPMVGIQFEYIKSDTGADDIQYAFKSGSGFFGLVFDFRYTFYFCVAGVPVYVGGEVNLTLITELGIAVDKDKQVLFSDKNGFNQKFFNDLIDNTHFEFLIKAEMDTTAYVGVGICGTLGVRGGFELNMKFIWNPSITKKYENIRPVGLGVSGAIKIWIDAIFLSIPIPVYSWSEDDWFKLGYFEDIENDNLLKSRKTGDSELYGGVDKSDLKPTPRFKRRSEFVANDNSDNDLFGGTYVIDNTKTRTLINDSYDSSDPKIVSYDSDGDDVKDKALLIYLDDDGGRSDLDRSVLKYMIYDVNSNQWSTPQVLQDDGTADFSPNMVDLDSEKIVVSWASRKTPVNNDTPKANLLKDMEIYSVFFDKTSGTFRNIEQLTNDDYYDYYPKASYDVLSGRLELYYLKNENVGAINDTDDLLNEVQTEVNGSQLMYRVYDLDWNDSEFKWLTDYEEYELPSTLTPTERTAFINKYQGQRIKDLSINLGETQNNNPNINDYAVYHSMMIDTTDEAVQNMINDVRAEVEEHFDPDDPSAIPASVEEHVNEMALRLTNYAKNYSVISYIVDEDGDPNTKVDTDVFVKIASNSDIKTIRITKNDVSDMRPKLTQVDGRAYLFWIQNESAIKMLSVSDLIQRSIDGEHIDKGIEAGEVTLKTTDKIIMSDKISNIEPFTDDRGNIYIAWQQNSNEIPSDEEISEEMDFKQDLYVAGLVESEDPDDPTNYIYSWSNPVRFTNNGKVNNLPAATDINNNLLLVNNQYNMKSNGNSYNITNSNLVSMTYKKKSSLEVMGVDTKLVSDVDGNKTYNLAIDIQNTGLYAAEGFDYEGTVKYDGLTLLNINGTSNKNIVPADEIEIASVSNIVNSDALKFTLTKDQQKRLDKVTLDLNVKEHGINDSGIDYSNKVFDINEEFRFVTTYDIDEYEPSLKDYLRVEQVGEDFVVKGILINSGNIDGKGNEKIYVVDQDDWDTPIAESDYLKLSMKNQLQFEIPISGDKIKNMHKGIKDLIVYVANDTGDKLSIAEVATLQVRTPYKFKVNGGETEVRVKVGETLNLNTTYEPTDRYQGATIMYAVTDGNIAVSGDNTITGLEEGVTTMKLTTKEYGGSTEINVIVEPNDYNGGRSYSGGSSGSGGGGGAGPMIPTDQVVSTTRVNTTKANALLFDVNANPMSWIYDPIANRYRLNINVAGNQVPATNGFYIINETKTIDVNGIPTPTLITDTYFFDNLGNMVTGWVNTMDNKWFFFENMKNINEGKMALGWKKVDNVWYYFTADGSMLTNSITPDGEQVGADGAWIAKSIYAVTQ